MNKNFTKVLALAMAASVALSACGSSAPAETPAAPSTPSAPATTPAAPSTPAAPATPAAPVEEDKSIKDLVLADTAGDLSTFNILYTQATAETNVLCNLVDGLCEINDKGQVVPCLAESWSAENNSTVWTFKLRQGVKWVDVNGNEKADVTAQDFVTGMEWILNFHKNASANTSMLIETIKGAGEYYEYTKGLSEEEGRALTTGEGSKFAEMVGIATPDDYTVVYTCAAEVPYFHTLSVYSCLYPASQALIDELGIDGYIAANNETMWYNGPYVMSTYVQGNEKVYEANPKYWDTESKRFDSVTVYTVESNEIIYQMYENGEVDYVQLGEAQIKTITEKADHKYADNMVHDSQGRGVDQFLFNYAKNNEDGTPDTNWNTAIANEAFRKAWYYGLDMTSYYSRMNAIDPLSCERDVYCSEGFVYLSDGTDYSDLVKEKLGIGEYNGETMIRLDTAKAAELKAQAMKELEGKVTFPVEADYYVAGGNQSALDNAIVLRDAVSKYLGDDFVKLNLVEYVASAGSEVRDTGVYAFWLTGWAADYGDPQNQLGQLIYGYDNAYFAQKWNRINLVEESEDTKALLDAYKEFTAMVEAANATTGDLDARYKAYAEAEAYLIDHALTVPAYRKQPLCLTKIDISSKPYALFGGLNNKMKNWETNSDGYIAE